MTAPLIWPQPDGTPLDCRDKITILEENHQELEQVMRDAFDDAILMGVDEAAMRTILLGMVQALRTPKR